MDGSGHHPYATPPRGMSLAPTIRPPPVNAMSASPAGLTRARPASANTRLRQKPEDAGQQDFFASLGVEATASVPPRRGASFTAGSNRSFSNITMRTSSGAATTTTTSSASSGIPSGLNIPSGLSANSGFRSGAGFFNSGTSSTLATPTGASTALGNSSNWRSPAAGAADSMFGAANTSSSSSLRSPAFSGRTTSFNSGLASPAAAALQSPATTALQSPAPFAMKSPASRNTWSAPPMRTTTPSGTSAFATSTSATPTGRSFATGTIATSTTGSFAGSASATPSAGAFATSTSATSTAGSFAGSASATPTGEAFATSVTATTTIATSATSSSLGRTVTTPLATQAAATSATSWQTGLSSAGMSSISRVPSATAASSATPSSVTSATASRQKPTQLFSMDDADDMFEDDGWGCDSPSTVLSNPMEEAENAEAQSAVKEESDEFGWAEDDFAMVDAALAAQPVKSSPAELEHAADAGAKVNAASITFSSSAVTSAPFAAVSSISYTAESMEQSWSTSRPSLPTPMDSKHADEALIDHQAEAHDVPVFAESKTEESRADVSTETDFTKSVAEEFEIPAAEAVTAVAAAGDFWNDDYDDEGLFDHDDHANEEWDETIRGSGEEPADTAPQETGAFTTSPSVELATSAFAAAAPPVASDENIAHGSDAIQEIEALPAAEQVSPPALHGVEQYSSVGFESRRYFESSSVENAAYESPGQQHREQQNVPVAGVFDSAPSETAAVEDNAVEQAHEDSSATSVAGGNVEDGSDAAVTASAPYSEEHSTHVEHHSHGVSFADEMHSGSSAREQAHSTGHFEEHSIAASATEYDTNEAAATYEDHPEASSAAETAEYERNEFFAKSSVSWESEVVHQGGAGNSRVEEQSTEAPTTTPGKTLDSDDHHDKAGGNDEYRGDSVSFMSSMGSTSGGQSLASFSEVSSRLPPYGYQSSFTGPGSEASSTEPGMRDMDGSSIRSYGVSSAGATFGGSERVSEGPFSDGTASETPSIVDSSNASTAFGTDFPSVSEGQFSAPGTTFGGSDNVSDQFSDGNASETTSVSESTTHTTTGFVSEYQPSTGHYVTETIAETTSLNPFPDDSMDERTSHGFESTEVTTTTTMSSLFASTTEASEYSQTPLTFSHEQESNHTQYAPVSAPPTEVAEVQEERALPTKTSTEIQSADALFGSSGADAPSPFSSFGSGPALSNSPPMVVEHELPTSDASDLFGSSAPSGNDNGFGSAPSQPSGFGYDDTSYGQSYQHEQGQQQSYEQQSCGQFGQELSAPANQAYGRGYDSYDYMRESQHGQAEHDPFQQQTSSAFAQDMFGDSSRNASVGAAASLFASTSSAASNAFETSTQASSRQEGTSYYEGSTAMHEHPSNVSSSNFFGSNASSQEPTGYSNYGGSQTRESSFEGSSAPTPSAESMFVSGPDYSRGGDAATAFGSSNQQSASQLFGSHGPPAATDSPFNTSGSYAPPPAHTADVGAPELTRHESASSVFSTHSAQSASFDHSNARLPRTASGAAGPTPSAPGASSAFAHGAPNNERSSSLGYGDHQGLSSSSDSTLPKHPQRGAHSGYETNEFFYATSRQVHHGFNHETGDASSFFGSSQSSEARQASGKLNAAPASADAFFGQSTSSTGASIHDASTPSTPGAASASSWFESSNNSVAAQPELQRGASNVSASYDESHHGATAESQQWSSPAGVEMYASPASSAVADIHSTAVETAHADQSAAAFGFQDDQKEYAQGGFGSDAAGVLAANQSEASLQFGTSQDYSSYEQQAPVADAFVAPPSEVPAEYESAPQLPQQDAVPVVSSPENAPSDVKEPQEPQQQIETSGSTVNGFEQQPGQEQQHEHPAQSDGSFAAPYDGFASAASSAFDQNGSGDAASSLFDDHSTAAAVDASVDPFSASASPFDNSGASPSFFSAPPPQVGGLEGTSRQNDFFASGPPAEDASSFHAGDGYGNETYGQQAQQQYGAHASASGYGANANQSGSYFDQQQQYQQPNQHQQYQQLDHHQQYEQAQQQQQSAYQHQYQQDQQQFEMQQQQQQQAFANAPQIASPQNQFQQQAHVGGYDQGYSSMHVQQHQQQPPQLQQFPTARLAGLNRAYTSPGFGAAKPSVPSPSPSSALASMAVAAHSPAVKASNKYKDPSRVAPSCLVAFGFGGNVVTMFPKRKLLLNIAGSSFRNSPRTAVPSQAEHAGHGELRKGPVGVYRMEQLHPKNEFMDLLEKFPGPLTDSVGDDSVLQHLEERMTQLEANGGAASEDERLLLGVLRVLVKCNGKLFSSPDTAAAPGSPHSDPNSPEALLIELLRESDRRRQAVHPVTISAPRPPQTGMHPDVVAKNAAQVRDLLLVGDRMAAVEAAMSAHMWAEALLLASSTTRDEYTRVVRLFLDAHYSSGDPSRALLLALADQQEKSVQEPQRLLQARLHHQNEDHAASNSLILATWVRHAQMLVANANPDTSSILTELGDRLWRENDAVVAAHACYLLAGLGVEAPSPAAKMALLGADHRSPAQARFYVSASSVQRTEVFEWAQRRALGSSATILLPFQGYKLIHAMVLADHGKLETAFRYVSAMLSVIRGITATMKPGTSMYLEGMQNQLTVLDDRLRQHLGQDRVATVAAAVAASDCRTAAGGRQGKWGFGSMLRKMGNVVNSIVEGGDAPPMPATAASSAALNAGGLFAGAAPGAIESPSAASTSSTSVFATTAPGSTHGNNSASGSVQAPGSSRSIHDYSSQTQQQQPPKSSSSSGPFSGRGGSSYTAPPPAPSQPKHQYDQQQYHQYDQQQQYEQQQQQYEQHQQHDQQQHYDHQQQYEQPSAQYDQQHQQQSSPMEYAQLEQRFGPKPSGLYSNTGSVGSGPPSSHGHSFAPAPAATHAPQPKFFGYNAAQQHQQPPRSNDSRASLNYGPGSNSGANAPAMMAPMATPPLSSSSASSLSGGRFQKPNIDLSGDAGPRGAFPAQDKAPPAASTTDAKEMEAKATTKAAVLGSGPASDKGKASPKHQDSKKGGRSKTPPPSSSKSSSGWFSGLSSLASGFIASKMNPDAKVAKLGEQMEAYYDEEKKRWVFPGETEAEEPSMPSAPPIGPLPGSTPASMSGLGGSGPPPPSSGPQSAPGSIANASDDPLAALMTPPPMRAHATLMNKDPLAAMMAPPPARVPSMYGGGSQRGRGIASQGSGRPSRPQFKVFKPVASSNPAPQGEGDAAPPAE